MFDRCLMKFSSTDCRGIVSGTKLTSIITSATCAGRVKRLFELTYPTMLSIDPRQTKIREYFESTKRAVSCPIEVSSMSTASISTRGTMQSRTRRSAKSSAFWKSFSSLSGSACCSVLFASSRAARSSRLKLGVMSCSLTRRPKRRRMPCESSVVKRASG